MDGKKDALTSKKVSLIHSVVGGTLLFQKELHLATQNEINMGELLILNLDDLIWCQLDFNQLHTNPPDKVTIVIADVQEANALEVLIDVECHFDFKMVWQVIHKLVQFILL